MPQLNTIHEKHLGLEQLKETGFNFNPMYDTIRYQKALSGELENHLTHLQSIQNAHIELTLGNENTNTHLPSVSKLTATLTITKPLSNKKILSIRGLLLNSVEGLKDNNLILLDTKGHLLSNQSQTKLPKDFIIKKTIEKYYVNKINTLFSTLFNPNDIKISIDVTFKSDNIKESITRPLKQSVLIHQNKLIKEYTKTKVPEKISKENNQFIYGQKKYHRSKKGIRIDAIHVSIAVPINTETQTIDAILKLTKDVIGFTEKRGDSIHVVPILPLKTEVVPKQIYPTKPLAIPHQSTQIASTVSFLRPYLIGIFISFILYSIHVFMLKKRVEKAFNELQGV